jgi:hypothetical protein
VGSFNFFRRQDQQILWLPTEAVRSIQQNLSSISAIKIFVARRQESSSSSKSVDRWIELPTSRKSNPIQAKTRRKVFIEKQRIQQVSTSSPSRIAVGLGALHQQRLVAWRQIKFSHRVNISKYTISIYVISIEALRNKQYKIKLSGLVLLTRRSRREEKFEEDQDVEVAT